MSRQGDVNKELINSVDDAINSTVSIAAFILRGKETSKESTKECCISI